jgi:hypothetical protein
MSKHNLHLYAYSGRENGLMLIGDAEALEKLGQEILASTAAHPSSSGDNWPRQIAVLNKSSPYVDCQDYQVSIHLQTSPLPQTLIRKCSRGVSTGAFWAITFLALAGAISLPLWLWRAL